MAVSTGNISVDGVFIGSGGSDSGGGGGSTNGIVFDDNYELTEIANIPLSQSGGSLGYNQNQTKYFGYLTKLRVGKYSTIELPYISRNTSGGGDADMYAILLDPSNQVMAYKTTTLGLSVNKNVIFEFDNEVEILNTDYYTIVLGFRNFNSTKSINLYKHSLSNSTSSIWQSTSNNLDVSDTSGVNFSSISKSNTNEIIRGIIY